MESLSRVGDPSERDRAQQGSRFNVPEPQSKVGANGRQDITAIKEFRASLSAQRPGGLTRILR